MKNVLTVVLAVFLLIALGTTAYFWQSNEKSKLQIADLEKGKERIESEVRDIDAKLTRMQEELNTATAEVEVQRQKVADLSLQLQSARGRVAQLLDMNKLTAEEAKAITDKLATLEQQLIAMTLPAGADPGSGTVEQAFAQIVALQTDNKRMQGEIETLRTQSTNQQDQIGRLTDNNTKISDRLAELTRYDVEVTGKYRMKKDGREKVEDFKRINLASNKQPLRIYFNVLEKGHKIGTKLDDGLHAILKTPTGTEKMALSYAKNFDQSVGEFYVEIPPKTEGELAFFYRQDRLSQYPF